MNRLISFTVAAALVGILMKWERRNDLGSVRPASMALKVKSAATKVEHSVRSVEAALEILMTTIANEKSANSSLA